MAYSTSLTACISAFVADRGYRSRLILVTQDVGKDVMENDLWSILTDRAPTSGAHINSSISFNNTQTRRYEMIADWQNPKLFAQLKRRERHINL